MAEFDSPWKEAIDVFFQDFLKLFFRKVHKLIDWSRRAVSMDTELSQMDPENQIGKRLADKLFKVWLKNGHEIWVLVHIEVQSQLDKNFPERMFIYHYRIYDKFRRPVISLAVLGDDDPDWRPDRFEVELGECKVGLEFPMVKLLDYRGKVDKLANSSNRFAAVVLAHLKTLETRTNAKQRWFWKVRLVKGLYQRGWDKAKVRQLFRVIDWMMELPEELENQFKQELHRFEKEKHMPFITSFERDGIKKGMEKGLKKGLEAGIEKGREEGREAVLQAIEFALECKFGPAGVELMPTIRQVKDLVALQTILPTLRAAANVRELEAKLLKGGK